MRIVIAGGGKLGTTLCLDLAAEGHDIILIEQNEEIIERLIERSDISGLVGNCVDYECQLEADVANSDLFISVTNSDEINLLAAIIAEKIGAKNTVARVNGLEYGSHMNFFRRIFGISLLINPKFEAAKEIAENINSSTSVSSESFAGGRVSMHEIVIDSDNQLINMRLSDFRQQFPSLIVCAVLRDEQVYVPDGSFILQAEDILQITGLIKDLDNFYASLGQIRRPIINILIIGGGEITAYLCDNLQNQNKKNNITVIEQDPNQAWDLASKFPEITVLEGDGTSHAVLNDINFSSYDAIIALTGIDEGNIMIGLLAAQSGISKIITKVNRTEILPIIKENRLQTIITPKQIVADHLIRLARAYENALGSKVEALYRLFDNKIEVLEFTIKKDSDVIGVPIKDLELKKDILIVFILRNNQVIFPTGNDSILCDDHIIVVSKEKQLDDVDDILA
ncbi:MAG: Trk system potassium transporter TrkA [Clostridiaceae bacterium]|nr:Trk system potassium transporter TrkA [Clostridiaceae bacterium]